MGSFSFQGTKQKWQGNQNDRYKLGQMTTGEETEKLRSKQELKKHPQVRTNWQKDTNIYTNQ